MENSKALKRTHVLKTCWIIQIIHIVQPCSALTAFCTSSGSGVTDLFKSLWGTHTRVIGIQHWFVFLLLQSIWSLKSFCLFCLFAEHCSECAVVLCVSHSSQTSFTISRPRLLPSGSLNFFWISSEVLKELFFTWLSSLNTGLTKLRQESSTSGAETSNLRTKESLDSLCSCIFVLVFLICCHTVSLRIQISALM